MRQTVDSRYSVCIHVSAIKLEFLHYKLKTYIAIVNGLKGLGTKDIIFNKGQNSSVNILLQVLMELFRTGLKVVLIN